MITKRKLNRKLDLLLQRQTIMMEVLAKVELSDAGYERLAKRWNDLWDDIIEGRYKIVENNNGERK